MQIHDNTEGVNLWPDTTHLSMLEVFMLRHPDMLDKVSKSICCFCVIQYPISAILTQFSPANNNAFTRAGKIENGRVFF